MGKPVGSNVRRAECSVLSTKINKEVFDNFKDYCSELGYPMNVMIETFMRQYVNGRFKLNDDDILKFKDDKKELGALNTTVNKEIYDDFKWLCKSNGFFSKHVVTAFMEKVSSGNFILEFVSIENVKE